MIEENVFGRDKMSIVTAVYVPEGIVIAGDSRLTGHKDVVEGEKTTRIEYTLTDNSQKVMLLSKVPVGIAFCGDAIIDGNTVADFIRIFEIDKVDTNDTVTSVAEKLHISTERKNVQFLVCGYNNDIPYVYNLYGNNNVRINFKNNEISYGASWAGQKEAITRLINTEPYMPIDWTLMPLKEGIDFAEFIVSTTINYERFKDDIQTCGGPIDILVINKDRAFWYKHKIFKP